MKELKTEYGLSQILITRQDLNQLRKNSELQELRVGQLEKINPKYSKKSEDIINIVKEDEFVKELLRVSYILEVESSCTWIITVLKEHKINILSACMKGVVY